MKFCGVFVKKTSFFSYLACVFVEFMCSRRTQSFQMHYFILSIATEGGAVPPKWYQFLAVFFYLKHGLPWAIAPMGGWVVCDAYEWWKITNPSW